MFVEDLFDSYVNELTKTNCSIVTSKPHDGCCAISYYDLSGIEIIFDSESSAKSFADKNAIDPSDFMSFRDGAWYCW